MSLQIGLCRCPSGATAFAKGVLKSCRLQPRAVAFRQPELPEKNLNDLYHIIVA
jgi:hypothetical protein